ncbi:MAG: hypothetical protein QOD70_1000 [Frankiales bacterium]|jgi:diguanylate cyclase (GGDEF)-like protein|nr:hypothetical protein [Frankiales bacterium]
MTLGAGAANWSTQQLTEMLALVSALPASADVVQRAVEHIVESLETDAGAAVSDAGVLASVGFPDGAIPYADLVAAAKGGLTELDVPGAGRCAVLVVPCDRLPGGRLLIARRQPEGFSSEERSLFRGFARVLALALQARSALQDERDLRTASEAEARHRQVLLDSMQERHALLERLSRIQRSISTRRPLHEVLESIVVGAAALIGDSVTALRMLDPDDPDLLLMVASHGLSPQMQERTRRSPVGEGVGGTAVTTSQLVVSHDYAASDNAVKVFAEDGVTACMAAPVFQGDGVVGSLTVASRVPGRTYSRSEQEVLLAFAEHTGLALNDARTVAALQEAVSDATRQARQDPLTGLPNRTRFLECLGESRANGREVSVLFIDLDDFKLVNDTLGHTIGDALLRLVADRLAGSVRGDDLVARLGGDEFAVLLVSTPPAQAELTAHRIAEALSQPFQLPGHQVSIGASTGVVLCSGDQAKLLSGDMEGHSAEELLRDADVAMYRAKALGKGRAVLFEPSMRIDLQARSRMERDLRKAMEQGQLVVHYQPIVDTRLGKVIGSEALLRWEHPELGLVPPEEFIPVAEDTGMIVGIGRQVLLDAACQTARWPGMSVSVNVSARQLADGLLIEHVREALQRTGIDPRNLTLELTETVLIDDIHAAAGILAELKVLGVRIAIDDFGTGYSSLSYLASLPVDVLKVDKKFVAGVERGGSEGRIAAAVVAIARSLHLTTITEGIETVQQLHAMQQLGCERFQGYFWSPAVPAAGFPGVCEALTLPAIAVPRARSAAS